MLFVTLFAIVVATAFAQKPNIIIFLTDDQDLLLDGMIPMSKTIKWIANEGATFTNAFANTPICCPSRSTILTGKYLHNHGVYNNSLAGNCSSRQWQNTQEPYTIANYLKTKAGYTTFYAGKYLNQYGSKEVGGVQHIPPGYDWWLGLEGNSKYFDYTLSVNGSKQKYHNEYLTDVIKDGGLGFLKTWNKRNPFFMMLAPPACHAPFIPAPRHQNAFPEVKAKRTPNFNVHLDTKHWLVNMKPSPLPGNLTILDEIQRKRWQTLLAVDEMVDAIFQKLENLKVLDDTYVIFTSDHGFHIGQFSLPWDKRQPYETDIRIPFLMRGRHIPKKSLFDLPISTVDIAPSILTLAGLTPPNDMDGKSFIDGNTKTVLDNNKGLVYIEYHGEGDIAHVDKKCPYKNDPNLYECSVDSWCRCQDSRNNTFTCLVDISPNDNFKYCIFFDDLQYKEAYNITADPYEMVNVYSQMVTRKIASHTQLLNILSTCSGTTCHLATNLQTIIQ